jgi:coenzyme F420-reducing hydrogenase gamma subunit
LKGNIPAASGRDFGIEEHLLRRVRKLSDVVRVDFYLPGCPPITHLLENLLLELKGEQLFEGHRQIVCSECPRKFKKAPTATIDVFPSENEFESTCSSPNWPGATTATATSPLREAGSSEGVSGCWTSV